VIVNAALRLDGDAQRAARPALSTRVVISSLPEAVAVIESAWLAVPRRRIVIRKLMYPAPLNRLRRRRVCRDPATRPLNATVTAFAFADAAGLFNATRKTNVVPATYVPLPVRNVGSTGDRQGACALMAMLTRCSPRAQHPCRDLVPVDSTGRVPGRRCGYCRAHVPAQLKSRGG